MSATASDERGLIVACAHRFEVTSIPLLVLFNGGRECARLSGALPAASIRQFLKQHI